MGPTPALYSFANTDDLANQLRHYIVQQQDEAVKHHNAFRVAVSGGGLPAILAKALLAPSNAEIQLSRWDIFFADERVVPLDHDQSNYKLFKNDFLDRIPSGAKMGTPTVHTIDDRYIDYGEQKVAELYQEDLQRTFAATGSINLPTFDLVLLGCGPDGHTCSLFPGHDLLREKTAWIAAETNSPKPPPKRITLTLPVVTNASAICFIVPGEETNGALANVFSEQESQLPAALVNRIGDGKVSWYTDEVALEGVELK